MDTGRLLELLPHYVAMLVLVYLVLEVVEIAVGSVGFWIELVIIAAVVFSYRPLVTWLGIGPSAWEE